MIDVNSPLFATRIFTRCVATVEKISAHGGKALAIATDVTSREQVKTLVAEAVRTFGRIDVLINNAGLMPLSPLERYKLGYLELSE